MKVFNGILFTLFVVLFVGCTESVVATDTPEFPPGLASALVDEKIISDLDTFLYGTLIDWETGITDAVFNSSSSWVLMACLDLEWYVSGRSPGIRGDWSKNHLAEEYLGNGVWKVQLVDSTGKLLENTYGLDPYEWNVYERTNTVARTSSAERRIC